MQNPKVAARYLQIVGILQARIASGFYPVGSLLPTEAELCTIFDVSRFTVREALKRLTTLGLVARRQGSGTLVLRARSQQGYTFTLHYLSELFQYSLDTSFQVTRIDEVVLDEAVSEDVGGHARERWALVCGLRSERSDTKPFCFTQCYVPPRLAHLVPELPDCVGPFYAHLEQRAGEPVLKAEQVTRARQMPPDVAAALGLPDGSLSLVLLRRYITQQGTLIASVNWHIADQFSYRMDISRDG